MTRFHWWLEITTPGGHDDMFEPDEIDLQHIAEDINNGKRCGDIDSEQEEEREGDEIYNGANRESTYENQYLY